ncbi:MAG: zinc-ribbon domain-containing protein [Candidatus Kariarchaeaceae archaeon]
MKVLTINLFRGSETSDNSNFGYSNSKPIFCKSCGTKLKETDLLCSNCGYEY